MIKPNDFNKIKCPLCKKKIVIKSFVEKAKTLERNRYINRLRANMEENDYFNVALPRY